MLYIKAMNEYKCFSSQSINLMHTSIVAVAASMLVCR